MDIKVDGGKFNDAYLEQTRAGDVMLTQDGDTIQMDIAQVRRLYDALAKILGDKE